MRARFLGPAICTIGTIIAGGCGGAVVQQPRQKPEKPAFPPLKTSPTQVAAVGRIPFTELVQTLGVVVSPVKQEHKASIGAWSCAITPAGPLTATAEDDLVVIKARVTAQSTLKAMGRLLMRSTTRSMQARLAPVLHPDGVRFEVRSVYVDESAAPLGKAAAFLHEEVEKLLRDQPLRVFRERVEKLHLPLSSASLPDVLKSSSAVGLLVGKRACLTLRATAVRVTRVDVDPSALRLALNVLAAPSLQSHCPTSKAPNDRAAPKLQVVLDLPPVKTALSARVVEEVGDGAATLSSEHARAKVLSIGGQLKEGLVCPDRPCPVSLTQAEVALSGQRQLGGRRAIDATITGWLVIGDLRRL